MRKITSNLLEQYFKGKDSNIPEVIRNIFAQDAVVTFDIETDVINFPSKIIGAEQISALMFADFHEKFEQIRSYYVFNDHTVLDNRKINGMNWLVIMRERGSKLLRVGTGYYDWSFEKQDGPRLMPWAIQSLHIRIENMVVFNEPIPNWFNQTQRSLDTSWVTTAEALEALKGIEVLQPVRTYLSPTFIQQVVNR